MSNSRRTPFEESAEEMTRQIFVLQARIERASKGSPEHEALLQNLAAVSVLKAASESCLDTARERSFTEDPDED